MTSRKDHVCDGAELDFSRCTYPLGRVLQPVYLCITCPEPRGLCTACSINCHGDHKKIELFLKRNFRCDCPTKGITHPCKLYSKLKDANFKYEYNQNFDGYFCRCQGTYDPDKEREIMIECLICEDWFHESCCNLRERPDEDPANTPSEVSDLPPPLLSEDDYDTFICGSCVLNRSYLRRWAGSPGVIMVIRESPAHPWRRFEGRLDQSKEDKVKSGSSGSPVKSGVKRKAKNPDPVSVTKRPKRSPDAGPSAQTGTCSVPPENPLVKKILSDAYEYHRPSGKLSVAKNPCLATGDIFLAEGFRKRWCRCKACEWFPVASYLLKEEIYEPPTKALFRQLPMDECDDTDITDLSSDFD